MAGQSAFRVFVPARVGAPRRRLVPTVLTAALVAAGLSAVALAPPASAATLTAFEVGSRPNATRVNFQLGDRVSASVDVGTGNLSVLTSELKLPGIARDLQLGMAFNSILVGATAGPSGSQWRGGGGYGWSTRVGNDLRVNANTDSSVTFFTPDGRQGRFVPSTGSAYTAPVGFKADLVKTGTTGWTLRDHTSNEKLTFNSAGKIVSITDRNSQATTFTYAYGAVSAITSTRSGVMSREAAITTDLASGLVTGMSQGNDLTGSRSVTYGYTGDQLTSITDTGSRTTTFGYTGGTSSSGGDLTSITTPGGVSTTIAYDSSHRATSVSRANAPSAASVTRFAYPTSTQTLVAAPNTNQSSPVSSVPRTTYTINSTRRVSSAVDPLGRSRSATYTAFADVASSTAPGGGVSSAGHSAGVNGGESPTSTTGAMGAGSTATYTNSSPSEFLPSGGSDSAGNSSLLTYDGVGNTASSTDGGSAAVASVTYNTDGSLATSTSPANKVTNYTVNAGTHQVTTITAPSGSGLGATGLMYDGYGRVRTVTDGRGAVKTYSYDLLDRTTSIAYSGGTGTGTAVTTVGYGYDTAGNQSTRTDGTGTTTYGYDKLARLTSRVATAGGGTLSYGYDRTGNLTSYGNSLGATTYVYDDANQLVSDTTAAGARNYYAYNSDGNRTDTWWRASSTTLPTPPSSWAAHTHTDYDKAGRIARTWTASGSSNTTRAYDTSQCYSAYVSGQACPTTSASTDRDLIQWSVDNLTAARSIYSYDSRNRLTGVTNYGGHTYLYTYDTNGNRTTVNTDGATTQTLTYNTASSQISSSGYGFDAAGNQTADPAAGTIAYDKAGKWSPPPVAPPPTPSPGRT